MDCLYRCRLLPVQACPQSCSDLQRNVSLMIFYLEHSPSFFLPLSFCTPVVIVLLLPIVCLRASSWHACRSWHACHSRGVSTRGPYIIHVLPHDISVHLLPIECLRVSYRCPNRVSPPLQLLQVSIYYCQVHAGVPLLLLGTCRWWRLSNSWRWIVLVDRQYQQIGGTSRQVVQLLMLKCTHPTG